MNSHLPKHVAIIMDGNGRWAQQRGQPRTFGHNEGAKRVDEIVTEAVSLGIRYLTLYTFSTENWNRPQSEVNLLMRLLVQNLKTMDRKLVKNRVKLTAQGTLYRLPEKVLKELDRVSQITSKYEPKMELNLCLSYGGRQEIVDAVRTICSRAKSGAIDVDSISEETVGEHLYRPHVPDPDLLIRTGGESRISNFLLWEIAYSEFLVVDPYWPEFRPESLRQALAVYAGRQRRFGKTQEQIEEESRTECTASATFGSVEYH